MKIWPNQQIKFEGMKCTCILQGDDADYIMSADDDEEVGLVAMRAAAESEQLEYHNIAPNSLRGISFGEAGANSSPCSHPVSTELCCCFCRGSPFLRPSLVTSHAGDVCLCTM